MPCTVERFPPLNYTTMHHALTYLWLLNAFPWSACRFFERFRPYLTPLLLIVPYYTYFIWLNSKAQIASSILSRPDNISPLFLIPNPQHHSPTRRGFTEPIIFITFTFVPSFFTVLQVSCRTTHLNSHATPVRLAMRGFLPPLPDAHCTTTAFKHSKPPPKHFSFTYICSIAPFSTPASSLVRWPLDPIHINLFCHYKLSFSPSADWRDFNDTYSTTAVTVLLLYSGISLNIAFSSSVMNFSVLKPTQPTWHANPRASAPPSWTISFTPKFGLQLTVPLVTRCHLWSVSNPPTTSLIMHVRDLVPHSCRFEYRLCPQSGGYISFLGFPCVQIETYSCILILTPPFGELPRPLTRRSILLN